MALSLEKLVQLCRQVEDEISQLHKRKELSTYQEARAELRIIRRGVFEIRNLLETELFYAMRDSGLHTRDDTS